MSPTASRTWSFVPPKAKVCAHGFRIAQFGATSAASRLENAPLVHVRLPRARSIPLDALRHVSRDDSKAQ
jgi:hypothetical protein